MKGIEELNKKFKAEYENYGGLELFTKYVMSETIAPIENYENVVNIIMQNYHKQTSVELLIVGAYLAIMWSHSDSELLGVLNSIQPRLTDKEKAIIHYLNAYKLFIWDKNYKTKQEYKAELYASLKFNTLFVNNRCRLAEISTIEEAKKYYAEALNNVQEVLSEDQITELPIEHFLEPQSFINEFILGTSITKDTYAEIKKAAI